MRIKKINIAVAGDRGSFSEEAALLYGQRMDIKSDLIFAIDMERVLSRVEKGKADLGIFPVVNSRGGLVQTAFEAMGRHLFELVDEIWLDVRQCLIAKPGLKKSQIKKIVSHPQALSQCERYLAKEFSGIPLQEWEDTAKAARDLAQGVLQPETAIIAPARCAKFYNLRVLERSIEDNHPNLTTFIVVKKHAGKTRK